MDVADFGDLVASDADRRSLLTAQCGDSMWFGQIIC